MNTRHMIAAAVLALTGVAASASPTVFTDMPSTMSRAEVQAQLEQARAEGHGYRHNDAYGAVDAHSSGDLVSASVTTRQEVLAELVAARRSGEFDARGEVYGDLVWTQFGNVEQTLPQQAGMASAEAVPAAAVAASESASVMSSYPSSSYPSLQALPAAEPGTAEPVVLFVPLDGEAITLQPGDSVLLMPSDEPLPAAE